MGGFGTLELVGDMSGFSGRFRQTVGETIVSSNFFSGNSVIENGSVLTFKTGASFADETFIELMATAVLNFAGSDILRIGSEQDQDVYGAQTTKVKKTGLGQLIIDGDSFRNFGGDFNHNLGTTTLMGELGAWQINVNNGLFEIKTSYSVGSVLIKKTGILSLESETEMSIDGQISGTGLIISKGGNVFLSSDNSGFEGLFIQNVDSVVSSLYDNYFMGISSIAAGQLRFEHNGGQRMISAGSIYLGRNAKLIIESDAVIKGSIKSFNVGGGTVTLAGNSLLRLEGDNGGFSGWFEHFDGSVLVSGRFFNGQSLIHANSVLEFAEGAEVLSGAHVNLADDAVMNISGATILLSQNQISGSGDVKVVGAGTLILSGIQSDWHGNLEGQLGNVFMTADRISVSTLIVTRSAENLYGRYSSENDRGRVSVTSAIYAQVSGVLKMGVEFSNVSRGLSAADLIDVSEKIELGYDLDIELAIYGRRTYGGKALIIRSGELEINNLSVSGRMALADDALFYKRWTTRDRGMIYTSQISSATVNGRTEIYLNTRAAIDPLTIKGQTHNESQVFGAINRGAVDLDSALGDAHLRMWEMIERGDRSGLRAAAASMSGSFYSDILTLAVENDTSLLYESMVSDDSDELRPWAHLRYGGASFAANDNANGDLKVSGFKFQGGRALRKSDAWLDGVYMSFASNKVEQSVDKAALSDLEAGYYRAFFLGKTVVKTNAAISLQMWNVTRHIEFMGLAPHSSFNTFAAKVGGEILQPIWKSLNKENALEISVFGGLNAGLSRNGEIQESGDLGLKVEPGVYAKMGLLFGLRIDGKSAGKLAWFGKLFIAGIDMSSDGTYNMAQDGQGMHEIEGSKKSAPYAGIGGGADYKLSEKVSLTANVHINSGQSIFSYTTTVGAKVGF